MSTLPYQLISEDARPTPLGLIVLQADETVEPEFRRSYSEHPSTLYVTRIPSGAEVTTETLSAMESHITQSASLLPKSLSFPVVGYCCTSASSVIGSDKVEDLVKKGCNTGHVTNPLRAATAYAAAKGISKLAMLSPYIGEVNTPLRNAFLKSGLTTDVFGTFGEPEEAKVARISNASIVDAASRLGADKGVEGVFLSCTNLRTYDAIPQIAERIGKPVFSSNSALAWHMKQFVPR